MSFLELDNPEPEKKQTNQPRNSQVEICTKCGEASSYLSNTCPHYLTRITTPADNLNRRYPDVMTAEELENYTSSYRRENGRVQRTQPSQHLPQNSSDEIIVQINWHVGEMDRVVRHEIVLANGVRITLYGDPNPPVLGARFNMNNPYIDSFSYTPASNDVYIRPMGSRTGQRYPDIEYHPVYPNGLGYEDRYIEEEIDDPTYHGLLCNCPTCEDNFCNTCYGFRNRQTCRCSAPPKKNTNPMGLELD